MADQKREFDIDDNREIDLNMEIDLNKEFDPIENIVSKHFLLRKVDKLEATHKIELEEKEREIEHEKQMLKELDSRWKSREYLLYMVMDELARRQVNEFLKKVDKLEAIHRVELEAKERKIEHEKQMLKKLYSWWKSQNDLLMEKNELAESQVNELLRKVDKLEATHKIELEVKEREIEHEKQMLRELDSQWKSREDLLQMVNDESAERQADELLRKVYMLEATCRIELEAKKRDIRDLKRHLEKLDSLRKSCDDLLSMTNDELTERQVNELLRKIDKLEATHKIELEEKERKIRSLKQHLEEIVRWWKSQKNLLCKAKDELEERQVNELLTKVFELENSKRLIDENGQVCGSFGMNTNY